MDGAPESVGQVQIEQNCGRIYRIDLEQKGGGECGAARRELQDT